MKTTLLFLVLLCSALGLSSPVYAQVVYQSVGNGAWTDPATWLVVSDPTGTAAPYPAPNANNIVTVSTPVSLNINYDVSGDDGFLTITRAGSLSHTGAFTLTIGDQRPNPLPRITIQPRAIGLALNLSSLEFNKATGTINAPVQVASCTTFGNNSDLIITSDFTINGNLLIPQGNSSVNAGFGFAGSLFLRGQVDNLRAFTRSFFFANTTIQGLNIGCSDPAPLPVELTSFTAVFGNNQVNLRWATASEKNSADFTVERSFDGKSFSAVTTVRAAGTATTPREYAATDRGMRAGLNYYRLKQTDLDGTYTYTQVLPVQVGAVEQQLQAYGDNGSLNIVLHTAGTLQLLRVLDPMGRVVYTESPTETTTGTFTRRVPVAGASGRRMYIVQAITSQGVLNEKFMVAE